MTQQTLTMGESRKLIFVDFCSLSRMQNLRSVSKNSGPILSRSWTKVYEIASRCRRRLVVSNALTRLSIGPIMFRSEDIGLGR